MRFTIPIACGFILLAGCGQDNAPIADQHTDEETAHSEDIVLSAEAAKIAGIVIEAARSIPMQAELKVPGVVTNSAHGRAVVTPPVDGKIVKLHAVTGQNVRAGQAIATIQSADLAQASSEIVAAQRGVIIAKASVREAGSNLELARSHVRAAQALLSRQKEFAKAGAFSQPALQEAQRDLNEAEAELESATQEHQLHDAQLERAERLYKQELISRTEMEQARLEVQNDRIRMEKASRQIDIVKAILIREKQVAERGLYNSREIQTAEAEVRAANLEAEQAKIKLTIARAEVTGADRSLQAAKLSYGAQTGGARANGGTVTIVAPIGGVVTHCAVTMGQAVERTTEVCEIENLNTVWVTASVPEKEIEKAKAGSAAEVFVKAFPNRTFSGVVQVVGSRLDPKSRTMPVQVLVDNSDRALRPDMFASVSIGVGRKDMAIVVKRPAIVDDGDRQLIYIAEKDGKYEERVVQTGRIQGGLIEIVSGINSGDQVVVKGGFVLKSEKVKGELKGHGH